MPVLRWRRRRLPADGLERVDNPTVASFTGRGPHPENEDAFLVSGHPADPTTLLCFIADGQGGHSGGARAARLACTVGLNAAVSIAPGRLLSPRAWRRIGRAADVAVARDPDAGLTTFAGLAIQGARLVGVSNGDSAVTVRSGPSGVVELTAEQSKNPPVGSGNAALAPFSAVLSEPWSVVAMSDGAWHGSGRLAALDKVATQRGEALIRALTDAAQTAGLGQFPDDITVVVLERRA